jgi:putative nucleotidyltransferase with HDIG domain
MTRDEALERLKENLPNQNLIKHSFAVEAIMRSLAQHFGEDSEKWGLAGLLHDIDYEKVKEDLSQHSLAGAKMLEELGLDKDICQAVKVHNEAHGILPETLMEKALFVVDPLTGLIVAATLVLPSKKIKDLTIENVLNRFKEKSFARGAIREIIIKCQELLGLKLEDFVKMGLEAMQGIDQELGLN